MKKNVFIGLLLQIVIGVGCKTTQQTTKTSNEPVPFTKNMLGQSMFQKQFSVSDEIILTFKSVLIPNDMLPQRNVLIRKGTKGVLVNTDKGGYKMFVRFETGGRQRAIPFIQSTNGRYYCLLGAKVDPDGTIPILYDSMNYTAPAKTKAVYLLVDPEHGEKGTDERIATGLWVIPPVAKASAIDTVVKGRDATLVRVSEKPPAPKEAPVPQEQSRGKSEKRFYLSSGYGTEKIFGSLGAKIIGPLFLEAHFSEKLPIGGKMGVEFELPKKFTVALAMGYGWETELERKESFYKRNLGSPKFGRHVWYLEAEAKYFFYKSFFITVSGSYGKSVLPGLFKRQIKHALPYYGGEGGLGFSF